MTTTTPSAPLPSDARRVLDFWFAPPGDPQHGQFRPFWFVKSDATDREIADRFGKLIIEALQGGLSQWTDQPEGTLALILLLDQFTRNVYRGTLQSFSGDPRALAAARHLVESGEHLALPPVQRAFVYMPFEHAEDLALQDAAVRLFTALVADAPDLAGMRDYAVKHREVIQRFDRFPHRNAVLGRAPTAEETAFLQQPGSSF